jgi:N-acetylmuramic acid 6-phosphate etherase
MARLEWFLRHSKFLVRYSAVRFSGFTDQRNVMIKDRSKLTTERQNPASADIDAKDTLSIVDIINAQDALIAPAVASQRKQIAAAAEIVAGALAAGGRLFYVGAGTSGRLGVLDASECPPTYGTRPAMVQGVIAGGRRALVKSVEGAEDDAAAGAGALRKRKLRAGDVVVGIAACGVTPFVRGAIEFARAKGCPTIFVSCAPEACGYIKADVLINPVVGPEVVTGSTRMKAGTATKLVLNTLSTTAMIKLGKVYGNLMVDLRATNAKLRDRSERIIMAATGVARPAARKLLKRADGQAKLAILMRESGLDQAKAQKVLKQCAGSLRKAISLGKTRN